jgi:cell division protein FtsI/penicillin-binding protein 2
LLQPFLLAVGQRDSRLELSDLVVTRAGEVMVDGFTLTCQESVAEAMTWAAAMVARCPEPMLELAEKMSKSELSNAIDAFGLLSQPFLPITTEGVGSLDTSDARLAVIGQASASVSPLQVGLALAALANGGQFKQAQMIQATQDAEGIWSAERAEETSYQVVPADVATGILDLFSEFDGIAEHDLFVLSGPKGEKNSWYLGLAPASNPRYGVVVVIENDDDTSSARTVGRALLKDVLDPSA